MDKIFDTNNYNPSAKDDAVSHWMLKLLFQDVDKGLFFMNENYIFSYRIRFEARNWAKAKLNNVSFSENSMEPIIKNLIKHYMFD